MFFVVIVVVCNEFMRLDANDLNARMNSDKPCFNFLSEPL